MRFSNIGMAFKKTDELVVRGGHSGVYFEGEAVPIGDPALQPRLRQRAGAQVGKKRRRLHFIVIGVENDFANRFGFLLCFLRESF